MILTKKEEKYLITKHPQLWLWRFKKGNDDWEYRAFYDYVREIGLDEKFSTKLRKDINWGTLYKNKWIISFKVNIGKILQTEMDDNFVVELIKLFIEIGIKDFPKLTRMDLKLIREKHDSQIFFTDDWLSKLYAQEVDERADHGYHNWAAESFEDYTYQPCREEDPLFTVLKAWREKPPPKRVLKDLKRLLNLPRRFMSCNGLRTLGDTTVMSLTLYNLCHDPFFIEQEYLELLIRFAGICEDHEDTIEYLSKKMGERVKMCLSWEEFYTKVTFGKKIVRFVEEHMDDEHEMKPMRARIEVGKMVRGEK